MKFFVKSLIVASLSIFLGFPSVIYSQTPKTSKPLMKMANVQGNEFTFKWNEPLKDHTYTLLIYRGNKSKKPIMSLPVQGGSKTITLKKDSEKIYWRVTATDPAGVVVPNRSIFFVKNSQGKPSHQKIDWILRVGFLGVQNSYKQDAQDSALNVANKSASLSGTNLFFKTEAWKEKFGVILGLKTQTLSSGSTDYSETEYLAEVGYHWKKSALVTHDLAAGMNYSQTQIKFGGNNGDYTRAFLTLRHHYEKKLSGKYSFGMDSTLMLPAQADLILPSVRLVPSLNWYFKPNWWLAGMAGFERNEANLKYSQAGRSGDLNVSSKIITYGLSLNWRSF